MMLKTFLIAYRLKDTYHVNSMIYALKSLPFIKKILPVSLYQHHGLKVLGHILSVLWEFISLFLGKFIYFLIMFMVPLAYMDRVDFHSFLQLLFFLTLIGTRFNTEMINPSQDKYYAIILMKMDSREYSVSQYIYKLLRYIIGLIPCFLFFTISMDYAIWLCFVLPIAMGCLKTVVVAYDLYVYQKLHRISCQNDHHRGTFVFAFICLIAGYGLLFFDIMLPMIFLVFIFTISLFLGIICGLYIFNYPCYHAFSHDLLRNVHQLFQSDNQELVNDAYHQVITIETDKKSSKKGFAYFHELFVKRHQKILWKTAKRQTYCLTVIMMLIILIICRDMNIKKEVHVLLKTFLPYFVFIMYLLNTTQNATNAMFVNCDHSMLTYSFYRVPSHILQLFQMRLKEMIKINLLPGFVLAMGYLIVSLICGGMNEFLNAMIGFISIISMSIFFSTHYLILYYLLQPYNMETEIKNPIYSLVLSLTYIVCYAFIRIELPTFAFGIVCIVFCIFYCLMSCVLVYKKAEQTFKIHN